jgi:hypothetical protein
MNTGAERGCLLPLLQSLISGTLTALLTFSVALWQEWPRAEYIAFAAGAAGACAWWWWNILTWRHVAFPELAQPVFYDEPVQAQPVTSRVKVELHQDENRHVQIADIDASPDQLRQLAEGLLQGQTFSEGAWTGAGRPFSKAEFHQLRTALVKRGWVTMRNPNAPAQGFCLTRPGAAVMRSFASDLPYQGASVSKRA